MSIEEEPVSNSAEEQEELLKSDEELARMLQVLLVYLFDWFE